MSVKSEDGSTRGLLNLKASSEKFDLVRLAPSEELAFAIAHFWSVCWDLRGQPPYRAEVLPHPCVHLTVERRQAHIHGVMTGKFTRRLQGQGRVLGVKFRPGAFYPILRAPLSGITDQSHRLRAIVGATASHFQRVIEAEPDERQRIIHAETFLRTLLPSKPDPALTAVRDAAEQIISNRELLRTQQVATLMGVKMRTLQRLFSRYVGVSPKWVIARYRLHEAIEQMERGSLISLTDLALQLGYADQAHFNRDFKAIVGQSPGDYRASSAAPVHETNQRTRS